MSKKNEKDSKIVRFDWAMKNILRNKAYGIKFRTSSNPNE